MSQKITHYDLLPNGTDRHEAFAPFAAQRDILVTKRAGPGIRFILLNQFPGLEGSIPAIAAPSASQPIIATDQSPEVAAASELVAQAYQTQPQPPVGL